MRWTVPNWIAGLAGWLTWAAIESRNLDGQDDEHWRRTGGHRNRPQVRDSSSNKKNTTTVLAADLRRQGLGWRPAHFAGLPGRAKLLQRSRGRLAGTVVLVHHSQHREQARARLARLWADCVPLAWMYRCFSAPLPFLAAAARALERLRLSSDFLSCNPYSIPIPSFIQPVARR